MMTMTMAGMITTKMIMLRFLMLTIKVMSMLGTRMMHCANFDFGGDSGDDAVATRMV